MALLGARLAMAGGKKLPYDAEVEWLKGDGVAYALTPVIPYGDGNHKYFFDFTFDTDVANDTVLTGVRSSTTGGSICIQYYSYIYLFGNYNSYQDLRINYKYYVNDVAEDGSIRSLLNGKVVGSSVFTFNKNYESWFDNRYPIFGRKWSSNSVGAKCKFKLHRWWIKSSDDELIMDLIPVRKGGIGYMYDTVTGTLCGNEYTEGAFTYGPDVE